MKLKLKELYCSVIKLDQYERAYVDDKVKLGDSPWIDYLHNGSTVKLYESFIATQKHPHHPDDYWYPIEKFNVLVENIKKYGNKAIYFAAFSEFIRLFNKFYLVKVAFGQSVFFQLCHKGNFKNGSLRLHYRLRLYRTGLRGLRISFCACSTCWK